MESASHHVQDNTISMLDVWDRERSPSTQQFNNSNKGMQDGERSSSKSQDYTDSGKKIVEKEENQVEVQQGG
jgi:hypothetical protein